MKNHFTRHKTFIGLIGLITILTHGSIAQERVESPTVGGRVFAMAEDDTYTYLGGLFNFVGSSEFPIQITGAALASNTEGKIDLKLPEISGSVYAAAPDGSGGWFIGGRLSKVGNTDVENLVHILSNGSLDPDWTSPSFSSNHYVRSLLVDGNSLYVGTEAQNSFRDAIFKLNTVDGSVDPSWGSMLFTTSFSTRIYDLAMDATHIYAVGSFTQINNVNQDDLIKISKADGTIDATWTPTSSGTIFSIEIEGSDIYVAGSSNEIGGVANIDIAKLNNTTGTADANWGVEANSSILDFVIDGDFIFAAGHFTEIDGTAKSYLAQLNKSDGSVVSSWGATIDNRIEAIAVDASGLYIGGDFDTINTTNKSRVARLSKSDATIDETWKVNSQIITDCIETGNNEVLIGNSYGAIGGNIASIKNLMRFNSSTKQIDETWIPNPSTTSSSLVPINNMAINDTHLYVSGRFSTIAGNNRELLAKLSLSDGSLDLTWNPNPTKNSSTSGVGIGEIILIENSLYVEGGFDNIGGGSRSDLAKLNLTNGNYDSNWSPNVDLPSGRGVFSMIADGDDIIIGGNFQTVDGQPREGLALLDGNDGSLVTSFDAGFWTASITSLHIDGNDLYIGGSVRYDGESEVRVLSKLNKASGALNTEFANIITNSARVDAIGVSEASIFVAGEFDRGNGSDEDNISSLNKITGAIDTDFQVSLADGNQVRKIIADLASIKVAGRLSTVNEVVSSGYMNLITCPTCGFTSETIACGDFIFDSSGSIQIESYLDTIPSTTPGVDSIVFVNVTGEVNQVYSPNTFGDTTLVAGESLNMTATTPYAAYAQFSRADNDWVEINGAAPALTGLGGLNRSVFMWVRQPNLVAEQQVLLGINTSSGGNISNFFIEADGVLSIFDGSNIRSSGTLVSDGQWHHVGYTYDETTGETIFYVDGTNVGSFTNSQTIASNSQISLGQEFDNSSTSNHFEGEMTEVSLWNEVLTPSDISLIMQAKIENSHPKRGNLVAYYPMLNDCGQNSGGTEIYDYSGNNFHGTASATDIVNTSDMASINGFNGASWFSPHWIAPNGSTLSTNSSISESTFATGKYQLLLINRHFAITENWNVSTCTDCSRDDQTLCGNIVTDSKGNVYATTTSFTDTLNVNGTETLKLVSLTSEVNQVYTQDAISNETLEAGTDNLTHSVSTSYAAYAEFQKADNDFVNIDAVSAQVAGTNRSIFLWMRQSTTVAGEPQMLMTFNSSSGGNICNLQIGTNEQLQVFDGSNAQGSGVVVTDGQWHHVGYTYDETTNETKVYVDGVNADTYTNGQSVTATSLASLGQEYDSGPSASNFFEGEITEVTIWNEVLTESEVASLMQQKVENTHPKYANLVAYYPMFNGCGQNTGGTEVYDFSGNDLHGTASANNIVNTASLTQITGFNGAGWFNSYWTAPDGSTVSTAYNIDESTYTSGTYRNTLVNRHFAVTEEWVVTANGLNTDPTIAEAIADVTVVYLQADSTISIADNFTDVETPNGLTYTIQGNTDNTVATASINGSDITIANLKAGTTDITVRATDPDNGFVEDIFTVTVAKANPAITFPDYEPVAIDAAPIEISATSNSEESPITFAFVSGPASLDGTTLSFGQTFGNVRVSASQAESANFKAVTFFKNIRVERPRISVSDVEYFAFETADYGSRSYSVSGDFLIDNVSITAPNNFEISTNNTDFSDQLVLSRNGNDLVGEPVSIFVRFVENPTPPFFAENEITHSSNDAVTQVSEIVSVICESNTDICAIATTVNSTEILVRWLDKAGSGATSYQLERATEDIDSSYQLLHTETATGATAYSFTDTELTPGQTYYYRVRWVKN